MKFEKIQEYYHNDKNDLVILDRAECGESPAEALRGSRWQVNNKHGVQVRRFKYLKDAKLFVSQQL